MTDVKREAGRKTRRFVGVRLSPNGLAVIDRLAEREGVKRSEMIRRLLAEAVTARRAS